MTVGCLFSGICADSFGRRVTILTGYAGMALCGACTIFAPAYAWLLVARLCNGVSCGLGLTAAFAMLTELLPPKYRAMGWPLVLFSITCGEIYAACGCLMWMPDLKTGQWRSVTLWCTVPSIVFLCLS